MWQDIVENRFSVVSFGALSIALKNFELLDQNHIAVSNSKLFDQN
jgi:hypothetical protein